MGFASEGRGESMRSILLDKITALDKSCEYLLEEYIDFCLLNAQPKSVPGETEYHHILPQSIWPEYKNLSDHPWNGVYLTYKNHYLAHSMLANATDNESAVYAWWKMNSGNTNYRNSDDIGLCSSKYAELREKHYNLASISQTEMNKDPAIKQKRIETLNKIGDDGLTGFERTGRKISEKLKGHVNAFNLKENKRVYVDSKTFCENWYILGQTAKYLYLHELGDKMYTSQEFACIDNGLDFKEVSKIGPCGKPYKRLKFNIKDVIIDFENFDRKIIC